MASPTQTHHASRTPRALRDALRSAESRSVGPPGATLHSAEVGSSAALGPQPESVETGHDRMLGAHVMNIVHVDPARHPSRAIPYEPWVSYHVRSSAQSPSRALPFLEENYTGRINKDLFPFNASSLAKRPQVRPDPLAIFCPPLRPVLQSKALTMSTLALLTDTAIPAIDALRGCFRGTCLALRELKVGPIKH